MATIGCAQNATESSQITQSVAVVRSTMSTVNDNIRLFCPPSGGLFVFVARRGLCCLGMSLGIFDFMSLHWVMFWRRCVTMVLASCDGL